MVFQLGDVHFPYLANPGNDERGQTAWYAMSAHQGTTLMQGEEIIPKDDWDKHGVTDGVFRLVFAPISDSEAVIYAVVAPTGFDSFRALLDAKELPEQFSGVVAIRIPGTGKIQLGPREAAGMKANMGIIPFLMVNAPEETQVKLPDKEALRAEVFAALRGVCIPRKISSRADYNAKLKATSFPQGDLPKIMWPAYSARTPGNNASGESIMYFMK